MKRAIARGRVFPQSYSTDRRYGRLSLKACALFPLMWANADDQGRLSGDPEEVKYACCPNIDHITKADVPRLLAELDKNQLIRVYDTPNAQAIQILDWWDIQKPQWAWPSDYPPPDGWKDRLRYKRGAKEVVTDNWVFQVSEKNASGEQHTAAQVSEKNASGEKHTAAQVSEKNASGEKPQEPLLTTHQKEETERGIRKRNKKEEIHLSTFLPSGEQHTATQVSNKISSGEKPPPSLINSALFDCLVKTFPQAFGKQPDSREAVQLRDLGVEISSAGGATAKQVYDAFKEAALAQKFGISYVRAILLNWLGVARDPPR